MPRNRWRRRHAPARASAAVLLALAMLFVLAPRAGAATTDERRLEETRAKLAQVQSELAEATAARAVDAEELAQAERHLDVVLQAVDDAALAVQRQRQSVERARTRLEGLRAEAIDHFQLMAVRAASLYKHGRPGPLATILSSGSASAAVARADYAEVVLREDHRTFEQMSVAQAAVEGQQETLRDQQEALGRVLQEQRELLVVAEEVRRDRRIAAAESRRRVDALKAREGHLAAEERQLAALSRRPGRGGAVSRAGRTSISAAGAGPVTVAGGWVFPANGPVTSPFGRRWGRMHQGIDIGAPTGTPIYAVAAGVVSYAGTMSGYGNIVLIDHGGGIVTAYAHQSRIGVREGQSVDAGDVIGAVGSTGNSTGPHLHFEVRVNGGAQNPANYL